MDDRLRRQVGECVQRLAVEEKERLAALGTFVEIEDLTTEIGDEVGRQLARLELSRRAEELAAAEMHGNSGERGNRRRFDGRRRISARP